MDLQTFLANLSIGDVGFAGLVSLAIYLIYTGRLVPRRHLDDTRQDRDAWRSTAETQSGTITEISHQLEKLLEYAKTSDHLIRSIHPMYSEPVARQGEEAKP